MCVCARHAPTYPLPSLLPNCSKWGKLRADMGREEPWELTYMAIGNEASPALLAAALSLPALLGARRARRVVLPLPVDALPALPSAPGQRTP